MGLRTTLTIAMLVLFQSQSRADIVSAFSADSPNGSVAGDTYTITNAGLVADGVTFDATLTVVGSTTLTQTDDGLGVAGDSSNLVSNGEFLFFSMTISNQVGGAVTFLGFTEIDFNFFTGTDSGVLSIDNSLATIGDNFFSTTTGANIVDISGTSPTLFYAIAEAGGAASNSFRVDDVSGRFVGVAAVPEASSLLFGGLLCTALGVMLGGRRFLARFAR